MRGFLRSRESNGAMLERHSRAISIIRGFLDSSVKSYWRLNIYILNCTSVINAQENTKCHQGMRRRDPSWLEGVHLTPELIYEYQMHPKTLNEVLKADLDAMKNFNQPLLVNDQLGQLYLDLEVEGFSTKLILEDGITSSGSDSGSSNGSWTESQVGGTIKKILRHLLHRKNNFIAVFKSLVTYRSDTNFM